MEQPNPVQPGLYSDRNPRITTLSEAVAWVNQVCDWAALSPEGFSLCLLPGVTARDLEPELIVEIHRYYPESNITRNASGQLVVFLQSFPAGCAPRYICFESRRPTSQVIRTEDFALLLSPLKDVKDF